MNTSCEKCIFALWEGNTQIGCSVGRLDKFAAMGDVSRAEKDGKDFAIINNRICLMCCAPSWLTKNPEVKNPGEELRKRIALSCETFVIVQEEERERIETTLKSLVWQSHSPAQITVILYSDTYKPSTIRRMFMDLQKEISFTWKIAHIQERGPNNEKVSVEWCLDHAIGNCDTPFYAVFEAGYEVPANFLKEIDVALNDNLEKFCALIPQGDSWNGAVIQTMLHKKLQGNMPSHLGTDENGDELIGCTIYDKIHFIANTNDQPAIIRRVEEICNL